MGRRVGSHELEADEGGGDELGQSTRVDEPGDGRGREQAGQHLLDAVGPQAQGAAGGLGELGVGLGGGQDLGEDGDVAGGALLGVQLAGDGDEVGEALDGVEARGEAVHPLLGRDEAGLAEQVGHGAEVVEDQGLVEPAGGGDGAGGDLGDAVGADRLHRRLDQALAGLRAAPGGRAHPASRSARDSATTRVVTAPSSTPPAKP